MTELLNTALEWAGRRFRVFPVTVGKKHPPLIQEISVNATSDPAQITEWWSKWPDANIGMYCPNHIVIDVDVKNGAKGVQSFKGLSIPRDDIECCPIVDTPSGGYHVYFSAPAGVELLSQNGFRPGLDIRARGFNGYLLAAGSIVDDKLYKYGRAWPEAGPLECPAELVELLLAEQSASRERKGNEIASGCELNSDDAIARATAYLIDEAEPAIEGQGGDNHTVTVANRVGDFGVSADMAHYLMLEHWNDRCVPPWELEDLKRKVDSAFASRQNPLGCCDPASEFAGVSIEPLITKVAPPPAFNPLSLQLTRRFAQLGQPFDPNGTSWLIYGKLPQRGTALMVAPTQSGKTFLAYALADCLARGEPFFGTKPDERVGTIILQSEAFGTSNPRLEALRRDDDDTNGLPVLVIDAGALDAPSAKSTMESDITYARDALRTHYDVRLGLIIIDTLSASRMMEDENSNTDAAEVIRFLGRLSDIFGCLVILIHHPPKSGGTRGAGALVDNVDLRIEIANDKTTKVRTVDCTKNRSGEAGPWGSFTLIPKMLTLDSKGREVTSCTVSMSDGPSKAKVQSPLPEEQLSALATAIGGKNFGVGSRGCDWVGMLIGKAADFDATTTEGKACARKYQKELLTGGWFATEPRRDEHSRKRVKRIVLGPKLAGHGSGPEPIKLPE